MKIKLLLIAICFVSLMGSTYSANAETNCLTVAFNCGDGNGTNALSCGESLQEIVELANEMADAFCG